MPFVAVGNEVVPYLIVRKQNKNAYLRLKPDGSIVVTAPSSFSRERIETFIAKHTAAILRSRQNVAKRIVPPPGMIRLWGTTIADIGGWNEERYKQETVRAATTALVRLAATLPPEVAAAGVTLRARLMKTRFGTCAPQKRIITLNSVLARYDRKYLEAILVHELVHFAHPDHGKGFYDTLLSAVPGYRTIRRELGDLFAVTEV